MKCLVVLILFVCASAFAERKPHVTLEMHEGYKIDDYLRLFVQDLPRIKLKRVNTTQSLVRGAIWVELAMPPSNIMREVRERILDLPNVADLQIDNRRYNFAKAKLLVERKSLTRDKLRAGLFPPPFGDFMEGAAIRDLDTGVLHVDRVRIATSTRRSNLWPRFYVVNFAPATRPLI